MSVSLNVFSSIHHELYFKGLENGCIVRKKLFEKGTFSIRDLRKMINKRVRGRTSGLTVNPLVVML